MGQLKTGRGVPEPRTRQLFWVTSVSVKAEGGNGRTYFTHKAKNCVFA